MSQSPVTLSLNGVDGAWLPPYHHAHDQLAVIAPSLKRPVLSARSLEENRFPE